VWWIHNITALVTSQTTICQLQFASSIHMSACGALKTLYSLFRRPILANESTWRQALTPANIYDQLCGTPWCWRRPSATTSSSRSTCPCWGVGLATRWNCELDSAAAAAIVGLLHGWPSCGQITSVFHQATSRPTQRPILSGLPWEVSTTESV